MDKKASSSWGFQPLERKTGYPASSGSSNRRVGAIGALPQLPGATGKLHEETAAAKHALKRQAELRRIHDKEFHSKQSIRKRQQEYDQAVKARLTQDVAQGAMLSDSNAAKYAQQQMQALQATKSSSGASMSGPRAKKLQAFARQPRPPQLAAAPRQLSRIPDDVILPDISGNGSKQSRHESASMAHLMNDDAAPVYQPTDVADKMSTLPALPKIASQQSSMRRMTQELQS
ncbi:hypothetical protein ABBQ32_009002 [Trebouxia sp. C0010 RCD-2024]